MDIKRATVEDAGAVSAILTALRVVGNRTKPGDPDFARAHYITHPAQIVCLLARNRRGRPMGFQSLKRAGAENDYGVPEGSGLIGTHIAPEAFRSGVGRTLFVQLRAAAKAAGLPDIHAPIGEGNAPGLAFYEAIGFQTIRHMGGIVHKRFLLAPG
ncbi:MAG: GNAT family N-acetyltransferase [Pseudomonadota bacterium]